MRYDDNLQLIFKQLYNFEYFWVLLIKIKWLLLSDVYYFKNTPSSYKRLRTRKKNA